MNRDFAQTSCESCGNLSRNIQWHKATNLHLCPSCRIKADNKPRTRVFRATNVQAPCGGVFLDGYEEIEMGNMQDIGIEPQIEEELRTGSLDRSKVQKIPDNPDPDLRTFNTLPPGMNVKPISGDGIQHHSGNKYLRYCQTATAPVQWFWIDVYVVLKAFMVTCPARQHAIKKLLCAGLRSKGTQLNDLIEARDGISRAIELQQAEELGKTEESKS